MKDIQRIGVGNSKNTPIDEGNITVEPGIFTFDSTTVTFDSTVDTFDFDIVPLPPAVKRDYPKIDYLETDYK